MSRPTSQCPSCEMWFRGPVENQTDAMSRSNHVRKCAREHVMDIDRKLHNFVHQCTVEGGGNENLGKR